MSGQPNCPPHQTAAEVAENLAPIVFPPFNWAEPDRSLEMYFEHTVRKAHDALKWYAKAKRKKKVLAGTFRWAMVIAGGIAAAMPTLAAMSGADWTKNFALLTTLLGLFVGLLLALDRLTGASTGWVRYIRTSQRLATELENLHLAYIKEKSAWGSEASVGAVAVVPNKEQALKTLDLLTSYVAKFNEIVSAETTEWITEFQSAMQVTEEYAKSSAKAVEQGSLTVIVSSDLPPQKTWLVYFNDRREKGSGKRVVQLLTPGRYRVRVEAKGSKDVNGTITPVDLYGEAIAVVEAKTDKELTIELTEA